MTASTFPQEKINQLCKILTSFYEDEQSAKRIVTQAGIDKGQIPFSGRAIDTWHFIIEQAIKTDHLSKLLDEVEMEYPDNLDLKQVVSELQPLISVELPTEPENKQEQNYYTPLSQGDILEDRYKIIKSLSSDNRFRTVYHCSNMRLGRDVAIKENRDISPDVVNRFQSEFQILNTLEHPSLPRVLDFFTGDSPKLEGRVYLVLEFIDGKNLQEMLDQAGPIPEKKALHYLSSAIDALLYMHEQKNPNTHKPTPVTHNDIKPANILQAKDGKIYLVDFGLARQYIDHKKGTTRPQPIASRGYTSPEQYEGKINELSDIYSLAATLYALLTGESPMDALERPKSTDWIKPKPNRLIRDDLYKVVEKAMDLSPEKRYSRIRDMRDALNSASPDTQLEPKPNIMIRFFKEMKRRWNGLQKKQGSQKRWYIMTAIAIGLILSIFLWWSQPTFSETSNLAHENILKQGYITVGVRHDAPPFGSAEGWKNEECDYSLFYSSRLEELYSRLFKENFKPQGFDISPKYNFTFAENFKPQGFDIDLVKRMAQLWFGDDNLDRIRFVCVTADDRISATKKNRVDFIAASFSYTKDRCESVSCGYLYFKDGFGLLIRADTTHEFSSFCELSGQTITMLSGTTAEALSNRFKSCEEQSGTFEMPDIQYDYEDRQKAIDVVISGEAAAYITDFEILNGYWEQMINESKDKLKPLLLEKPNIANYHFAVHRNNHGLRSLIDLTFCVMKLDGSYDEIFEKNFNRSDDINPCIIPRS